MRLNAGVMRDGGQGLVPSFEMVTPTAMKVESSSFENQLERDMKRKLHVEQELDDAINEAVAQYEAEGEYG